MGAGASQPHENKAATGMECQISCERSELQSCACQHNYCGKGVNKGVPERLKQAALFFFKSVSFREKFRKVRNY